MAGKKDIRFLINNLQAGDDQAVPLIRADMSGGVNSRVHATKIKDNQAAVLENVDIGTPGERKKRPGSVLIGNDIGAVSPVILHNFEIQGATDKLLMYEDTHLYAWTGSGNWSSWKADFTTKTDVGIIVAKEAGQAPDDVAIVQNGAEQFRFLSDGTAYDLDTNHTLYKSTVMAWYGNRIWCMKNDLLQYSDAYPDLDDGSDAFNNAAFRIPVGEERAIVPTRDLGMILFGAKEIWALAPSATPAATDRPEPIITDYGAVSKKGVVASGDDIYFFANDGLRSLKRTIQDKLQAGASYPVSYQLKDEFAEISWANIANLSMVSFDNKIFISVPLTASTYKTWIYYPATDSFTTMTGFHPTCWATYKVSNELRLYYGKQGDGKVYRGWHGFTDEGTTTSNGNAIDTTEEGREEDFGQPMVEKTGGEVEIEAVAAGGDYELIISARINGGAYSQLGIIDLQSDTAPTLPVSLPFNLSDAYIIRTKFPLDELGEYRTLQVKWENTDANSEEIVVQSINYASFPLPYNRGN